MKSYLVCGKFGKCNHVFFLESLDLSFLQEIIAGGVRGWGGVSRQCVPSCRYCSAPDSCALFTFSYSRPVHTPRCRIGTVYVTDDKGVIEISLALDENIE